MICSDRHETRRLEDLLEDLRIPHRCCERWEQIPTDHSPPLLILDEAACSPDLGRGVAAVRERLGHQGRIILLLRDASATRRKIAYLAGADDAVVLPSPRVELAARIESSVELARLQLAAHGSGSVTDPAATPSNSSHCEQVQRVLVTDDDPIVCDMLCHHFERKGWNATRCGDGMEATERLISRRFDLLVLDLLMPFRSGFEVLEWLKGRPDVARPKVMMLTSAAQDRTILRAFELGADDFVSKPFSPMVVVARAKRLVGRT